MKNVLLRNRVLQFAPRLILVPIAGFFLTIGVSYVLGLVGIGSVQTRNLVELWIIPVLLGVAVGLLINYKKSVLADCFVWIGPPSWYFSLGLHFTILILQVGTAL